MKIYDMHIHTRIGKPDPEDILKKMEAAGVYGGCLFSVRPREINYETGLDFEERLANLLEWTRGYEGRLFPILWIHPDEENLIENIHTAVSAGVMGFKIICNNFYIYEERCLEILREIAKLNKPVIFHSGILWDGTVSSNYNRPLNWESLIDIEGLRFSMGHCSWPWIDECIAMYGKFLNALARKNTAEMFLDITPGTPEIYRKELLTKLFTIGYDVGHNLLFGTDGTANSYRGEWTTNWLNIDKNIMDELGVSHENRCLMYEENLMRFLGLNKEEHKRAAPQTDNSHAWSPVNSNVEVVIKKWYDKLDFPKEFDVEFGEYLKSIKISDTVTVENYPVDSKDGGRNLLTYLYLCEKLSEEYKAKGIPEGILIDTLKDIVRWTETYTDINGRLYLGELHWLERHLAGQLYKVGRLQYCMAGAERDMPKYGLKKGDPIMEIHIPADGRLTIEECNESIEAAKDFFKKYFPEYDYQYFTCHSWLLDTKLKEVLPESSNILKFAQLFDVLAEDDSSALIKYIWSWDMTERKLKNAPPINNLATKVKEKMLKGEIFHESLGVIVK